MRVSLEWLKEYVEIKQPPEELAEKLTMSGIEVSSVEFHGKKVEGVVAGKIKAIEPHIRRPDLYVCQVDIGKKIIQVVTDAPNLKVGDKVPVALHGAKLVKDISVKRMELHGVESFGMLCKAHELGVSEAQGILILGYEALPGEDIRKVLGMGGYIFEIDVLPNRPDLLSVIGIAREIAALTGAKLKYPEFKIKEEGEKVKDNVEVSVKEKELCGRYMARIIEGVEISQSPDWLKERIIACGLRPINNIVDVTNYVLMEMGQPMHAFDLNLIKGSEIIVRKARPGEKIVTIDGVERKLSSENLLIADLEIPIAIAGVMGGRDTEVNEGTRNILLESAYFNPASINRTAKAEKLRTESSVRFSTGVDFDTVSKALDRGAGLISKLSGGKILKGVIDVNERDRKPKVLVLRSERVNKILGTNMHTEEMASILRKLQFKVGKGKEAKVEVPLFRAADITREIDLIEEIARVYGYERVKAGMPAVPPKEEKENVLDELKVRVREILVGHGLTEVVTYSMINLRSLEALGLPKEAIPLSNPLSENESVLRTTLMPSLLQVLNYNFRRQIKDLAIFEIDKTFVKSGNLPKEKLTLGVALSGDTGFEWQKGKEEKFDLYHLKGITKDIAESLGAEIKVEEGDSAPFHPGKCALIKLEKSQIGVMGELHPDAQKAYDLSENVYLLEIEIEPLIKYLKKRPLYKPLPKFPSVDRDMAIIIPEGKTHEEILATIKEAGGALVEEVRLFDLYRGSPIPSGHISLAFSIKYRDPDRTLTDEEINTKHSDIGDLLAAKFNAEIRK